MWHRVWRVGLCALRRRSGTFFSAYAFTIATSKAQKRYLLKAGLLLLTVSLTLYYMGLFGSSSTETASAQGGMTGSDPKSFVDGLISSEKVVIFSKSYCPFCKKAKAALQQDLGNNFTVVELDERQDGDAIQDYLNQLTGGRSVPRVFIAGKFIGGGDDTVAKQQSGELKKILQQAGAL